MDASRQKLEGDLCRLEMMLRTARQSDAWEILPLFGGATILFEHKRAVLLHMFDEAAPLARRLAIGVRGFQNNTSEIGGIFYKVESALAGVLRHLEEMKQAMQWSYHLGLARITGSVHCAHDEARRACIAVFGIEPVVSYIDAHPGRTNAEIAEGATLWARKRDKWKEHYPNTEVAKDAKWGERDVKRCGHALTQLGYLNGGRGVGGWTPPKVPKMIATIGTIL